MASSPCRLVPISPEPAPYPEFRFNIAQPTISIIQSLLLGEERCRLIVHLGCVVHFTKRYKLIMVQVVSGFSPMNRWLLYASCMLAPAQFISGIGNNWPSNIGFLAFNIYTQTAWHTAVRHEELHALCLLVPHFTFIWAVTYLGGITSGNLFMGAVLGFGTAGVLLLNGVTAWISFLTNQPEGFGVYQFYFFGWRTLDHDWHTFFLVWQIFDTLEAVSLVILAITIPLAIASKSMEAEEELVPWWSTYPAVPAGAALVMLALWTLILWTELIVSRNQIESDTDWTAVWLFIAQVGAMLVPAPSVFSRCVRRND